MGGCDVGRGLPPCTASAGVDPLSRAWTRSPAHPHVAPTPFPRVPLVDTHPQRTIRPPAALLAAAAIPTLVPPRPPCSRPAAPSRPASARSWPTRRPAWSRSRSGPAPWPASTAACSSPSAGSRPAGVAPVRRSLTSSRRRTSAPRSTRPRSRPVGPTAQPLGLPDGRRVGEWVNPQPVGVEQAMGFSRFCLCLARRGGHRAR